MPRQPVDTPVRAPWVEKALAESAHTRTGAILRCALGLNNKNDFPRFMGKASVTSDGWLMCDFIGSSGQLHRGAFVGAASDLTANIGSLAAFLKLNSDDHEAMKAAVANWIGKDYRS
jgi:hypothetical protein